MILQSIDHRTARRILPHPRNVLEYSSRHFGLNMSERQDLLNSLWELFGINPPPLASLSLYSDKIKDVSNSELVKDQVDRAVHQRPIV